MTVFHRQARRHGLVDPTADGLHLPILKRVVGPQFAVGREQHRARLGGGVIAAGQKRHIIGAGGQLRIEMHQRVEHTVDRFDDRRRAAEIHLNRQRLFFTQQQRLCLLVDFDVGPAKTVDRLLRIADDDQFAPRQFHVAVIARRRTVFTQEKRDFDLQRVGILKFVDQQVTEAPLKIGAHRFVIAQ